MDVLCVTHSVECSQYHRGHYDRRIENKCFKGGGSFKIIPNGVFISYSCEYKLSKSS
jgi:hypothetical protein